MLYTSTVCSPTILAYLIALTEKCCLLLLFCYYCLCWQAQNKTMCILGSCSHPTPFTDWVPMSRVASLLCTLDEDAERFLFQLWLGKQASVLYKYVVDAMPHDNSPFLTELFHF